MIADTIQNTATQEEIAAAWSAWQSRHGGKLGPGPAFVEAINAALALRLRTLESLQRENDELNAGIKRLSDEEELLAETADGDMISTVKLAAKLAEAENLARTFESEANQLRDVSISNRHRAEAAEAEVKRLKSVLGPIAELAGDVSELWPDDAQVVTEIGHFRRARTALASTGGEHHAE